MKAQLTTEQSEALNQSGDPLPFVDPSTHRVYVLVDQYVHQQASMHCKGSVMKTRPPFRRGSTICTLGEECRWMSRGPEPAKILHEFRNDDEAGYQ